MSKFSKIIFLTIILGIFFIKNTLWAKEYQTDILVTTVDELYDLHSENELTDTELDELLILFDQPININKANRLELYTLPSLTWSVIDSIIAHRKKIIFFKNKNDLFQVKGLNKHMYLQIKPFISFKQEDISMDKEISGNINVGTLVARQLGEDHRQHIHRYVKKPFSSYWRTNIEGYTYFSAGIQLIQRPLLDVSWNRSVQKFTAVSNSCEMATQACAGNKFNIEGLYVTMDYENFSVITGTYNIGFAEKLTLNTANNEFPHGFYKKLGYRLNKEEGSLAPHRNLLGIATTWNGDDFDFGFIEASVFASYRPEDLYQYNFSYEGQTATQCSTDSDCINDGYSCDVDQVCRSSKINYQDNSDKSYVADTLNNAYSEFMFGGNITMNFNDYDRIGITTYRSKNYFNLSNESNSNFTPNTSTPQMHSFGAVGVNGALGDENVELATEISMTLEKDFAGVFRSVFKGFKKESILHLYYYGENYENPHSSSISDRALTLGLRRRNARGIKGSHKIKFLKKFHFYTRISFFQKENYYYNSERILSFDNKQISYLDGLLNIYYKSYHNNIGLQFEYKNNDLKKNTREEVYSVSSDLKISEECANNEITCLVKTFGSGESRKIRATISTSRLFKIRLKLQYSINWLDVSGDSEKFGLEQYGKFSFSRKFLGGSIITASIKYSFDKPLRHLWSEENLEGGILAWLTYHQKISKLFSFHLTYGILGENRTSIENEEEKITDYSYYAVLQLTSHF